MVILIAFLPGYFAINTTLDLNMVQNSLNTVQTISVKIDTLPLSEKELASYHQLMTSSTDLKTILANKPDIKNLSTTQKFNIRKAALTINKNAKN